MGFSWVVLLLVLPALRLSISEVSMIPFAQDCQIHSAPFASGAVVALPIQYRESKVPLRSHGETITANLTQY